MRLDRKLLLIAPTIILLLVFAGFIYTAAELRVLSSVSANWKDRSDYITAVQRGEKSIEPSKALALLQFSLDAEAKRTAAITASRDLVLALSVIGLVSCAVLAIGVRSVPRENWPTLRVRGGGTGGPE